MVARGLGLKSYKLEQEARASKVELENQSQRTRTRELERANWKSAPPKIIPVFALDPLKQVYFSYLSQVICPCTCLGNGEIALPFYSM